VHDEGSIIDKIVKGEEKRNREENKLKCKIERARKNRKEQEK